jgi:hypothetical protein
VLDIVNEPSDTHAADRWAYTAAAAADRGIYAAVAAAAAILLFFGVQDGYDSSLGSKLSRSGKPC